MLPTGKSFRDYLVGLGLALPAPGEEPVERPAKPAGRDPLRDARKIVGLDRRARKVVGGRV